MDRRKLLASGMYFSLPAIAAFVAGCNSPKDVKLQADDPGRSENSNDDKDDDVEREDLMRIHYLEIVTTNADGLCQQYSIVHGIEFSEPDANLGNARTAKLNDGGTLGIRGPLRPDETPVIRPYVLVEDIEAAVKAAAAEGAEVALPPMELPGHGTCAIVIQGGIECGFWQNAS